MRPTMTSRTALLITVALAGCSTKNQSSYLEILRVVPGAFAPATPTAPASCTISPNGTEVDFLNIDLTKRFGQVGVVVQNALQLNANTGVNRLNTNDFIADRAVISYEVIGGSSPAQVNGVAQGIVQAASTGVVGTFLFPQGGNFATSIGANKTVRVTFHIEGKLNDGSSVRTNEYEYVFLTCASSGAADCSTNQCL